MMTEPQALEQPERQIADSDWSPLKTVLSMAIGAALGASVYLVAEARHAARPLPLPAAAPVAREVVGAKVPEARAPEPEVPPQPPAAAPATEPDDAKARALAARSAAEQTLLDEARTQLDAKNASAALATLDRMKKRFAHGTLTQERELLRIEVYKSRGQLPAAKRAARKFAKAYPDSPHLAQLEALTSS